MIITVMFTLVIDVSNIRELFMYIFLVSLGELKIIFTIR